MNNYCMHCGNASPPGSKFCNQCGKKFGSQSDPKEKQKDILPQPGAKPDKKKYPKEPEEGDTSVLSKKGRSYSSGPISRNGVILQSTQRDEEEPDDTFEEDGPNDSRANDLNYVPDLSGLEIEPIAPPVKQGETWASMLAQAEADKQRKG